MGPYVQEMNTKRLPNRWQKTAEYTVKQASAVANTNIHYETRSREHSTFPYVILSSIFRFPQINILKNSSLPSEITFHNATA